MQLHKTFFERTRIHTYTLHTFDHKTCCFAIWPYNYKIYKLFFDELRRYLWHIKHREPNGKSINIGLLGFCFRSPHKMSWRLYAIRFCSGFFFCWLWWYRIFVEFVAFGCVYAFLSLSTSLFFSLVGSSSSLNFGDVQKSRNAMNWIARINISFHIPSWTFYTYTDTYAKYTFAPIAQQLYAQQL